MYASPQNSAIGSGLIFTQGDMLMKKGHVKKLIEMYKEIKFEISKEDCILIDYALFFDEQLGKYNHFCIDNILDLLDLKSITDKMVLDGAKIYVCAYSYESRDLNGLKYIYADSLWIETQRSIREIESLFEQKRTIEPSVIMKLSENEEFEQEKYIFLVKRIKLLVLRI